jgi:hypothetical protein
MKPINFATKPTKRKERHLNTYKELLLISATVKVMLERQSLNLTRKDYEQICLSVFQHISYSKRVQTYYMINDLERKQTILSEVQKILIARNIKPIEKSLDLAVKGEEVAKNTSDYMQLSRYYKDLSEIEPKSTNKATYSETTDFSKIGKDGTPAVKVTKTLEISGTGENTLKTEENSSIRSDKNEDNAEGNDNV